MSNRTGTGRTRGVQAHSIKIVKAATSMEARRQRTSVVRCAQVKHRVRCPGYLSVRLQDIPPQVHWSCPICRANGRIDDWAQTPWNLSRGRHPSSAAQLTWEIERGHHLILSDVNFMDPESDRIVFSGRCAKTKIVLRGSSASLKALLGDIEAQGKLESRPRRRGTLDKLSRSLADLLEAKPPPEDPATTRDDRLKRLLPLFPTDLTQRIERTLEESGGLNKKELTRYLSDLAGSDGRLSAPPSTGLIPVEIRQLLGVDFRTARRAIRIGRLTANRARDIPWVLNARTLLEIIENEGPIKATAKGNLNRKFVRSMIGRLPLAESYLEAVDEYRMIWNEFDVWELHILRLFCQWAGLVRLHKGRFHLTQKGRKLSPADWSGELHFLLFSAYYNKLNLSYLDRFPENDGLQSTLAFSLYVIGREAERWRSIRSLLPLLSFSNPSGNGGDYGIENFAQLQVESRILRPLIQFGLLESRQPDRSKTPGRPLTVRKSSRFDQFIRFSI